MRLPGQSDPDPTTDIVEAIGVNDGLGWVDWAVAGGGFVATVVLAQVVKWGLNRVLSRRLDAALAALMARLAGYVVVAVGLIYVLGSLGVQIVPLLGALGIAGLALALLCRTSWRTSSPVCSCS